MAVYKPPFGHALQVNRVVILDCPLLHLASHLLHATNPDAVMLSILVVAAHEYHRAVFGYRGAVFAGVPGVLLGHGGNHPWYASYVEVPRNFWIISFYTHICMMTRLMTRF